MRYIDNQQIICMKYGVAPYATPLTLKVGISADVFEGKMPINGMRITPEGDTSGWYIWAGEELSQADNYFEPMHVAHIKDMCPYIFSYLLLPPGWRFLLEPKDEYEDVWYDASLIE